MSGNINLVLAYGLVVGAGLMLTTGFRNRSIGEVLKGQTSQKGESGSGAVEGTGAGAGAAGIASLKKVSGHGGRILSAAGQGESIEESAIVNSGWAGSGYNGHLTTATQTAGNQTIFADAFSRLTGLSLTTVEKWLLSEQPPGSPATPGSNNWLNVQYTESGPNETYYAIAKLPPVQAAEATVKWMRENGY